MYVGDNDYGYFPLRVSAAQGADRIWRYTGLDALAPNASVNIGRRWSAGSGTRASPTAGARRRQDARRLARHRQPDPGQRRLPDARLGDGDDDQVHGAERRAGRQHVGTNQWNRGLAQNVPGEGEPDLRIQQATTNILADMGAMPATPHHRHRRVDTWPPASCSTTRPTAARPRPHGAGHGHVQPADGRDDDHGVDVHPDRPGRCVRPGDGDVQRGVEDRVGDAAEPAGERRRRTPRALTTGVKASDGSPLAAALPVDVHAPPACPCSVYGTATPAADRAGHQTVAGAAVRTRWSSAPSTSPTSTTT